MMPPVPYEKIVEAVISRLAAHMGANGRKGRLIAVFTGATAALPQAVAQVRGLVMSGFRIETVFSNAAEDLYEATFMKMMRGFPHISTLDKARWPITLEDAVAVVVPMLSLTTLSKVALLTADTLSTNLIVRALFMGRPVVAAHNGVQIGQGYWKASPSATVPPALEAALQERLQTLKGFGCQVVDITALKKTIVGLAPGKRPPAPPAKKEPHTMSRRTIQPASTVVTASQVRMAHAAGADIILRKGIQITPLARELAQTYNVALCYPAPHGQGHKEV